MNASKYNTQWSREELILALYLYCQIPFAKTKANNPEVLRLAVLLGRTPSSVARKLGNFGAFDPLLSQKGISGLTHFSKADRRVWNEFYGKWDRLVLDSQRILSRSQAPEAPSSYEEPPVISRPTGRTQRQAAVMIRVGQDFFRRAVLSSYEYACCVCGLDLPPLLTGSHILPWSVNADHRTDPENGLCLCALHDRAFDRGFISITGKLEVVVSSEIVTSLNHFALTAIGSFGSQRIRLPRRFAPKAEYLEWHRLNVFRT